MPPYYSQQMIARNYLPLCVEIEIVESANALDVTATRSETGRSIVVKVVNLESEDASASIDFGEDYDTAKCVRISCLSGNLTEENTPDEPDRIVPVESEVEQTGRIYEHVFPGYSFTVLRFDASET